MRCPRCEVVDLLMMDRSGIEVDYCPTCRGVWLDRGELDKVIERTAASMPPTPYMAPGPVPTPPPAYGYRRDDDDDDDDDDRRGDDYHRRRKRRGFLGDIFDF